MTEENQKLTDALVEGINLLITKVPDPGVGEVSDGYHTFGELYAHRIALYIALCRQLNPEIVWRSRVHSDGTVMVGWFILGIHKAAGRQITYHLPEGVWDSCNFAQHLLIAPIYDGHTPNDVLFRLAGIMEGKPGSLMMY